MTDLRQSHIAAIQSRMAVPRVLGQQTIHRPIPSVHLHQSIPHAAYSLAAVTAANVCHQHALPAGIAGQLWKKVPTWQTKQPPCQQQSASKLQPAFPRTVRTAAAAATSAAGDAQPDGFASAAESSQRFLELAGKFMPMVGLFFLLAFVNTILDSLKDTLVITAAGGGAQVIPYLTVYAVLPTSLAFLVAYSYASQHLSRPALFNSIMAVFMGFFTLFAFVLYPNHQMLHPADLTAGLAKVLPQGVEGLVGMIRNWTFTAFFCMSELWGDVCLGLLFWGLANDTTQLSDAPTLYPLFGIGANVAQALAGTVLKAFSKTKHSAAAGDFGSEIQHLMIVVIAFSCAALALHAFINHKHQQAAAARRKRTAKPSVVATTTAVEPAVGQPAVVVSTAQDNQGNITQAAVPNVVKKKAKPSVTEIFKVLANSVPIRCLAIMSLAQGLCTSLMEFAWKSHIGLLFPSPPQFTAFLGDVSMWQGVVTGCLMFLSPAVFKRLGWVGVAGATPKLLLWGGGAFFTSCLVYQFLFSSHAAASLANAVSSLATGVGVAAGVTSGAGGIVLQCLVYGGALLYVFSRSAKFSLFKPAEEMVYISLDEEGRTKGKAAIDVVGSQAGKSGGSVLQQVLLLISAGHIAGILPVMAICYLAMTQGWLRAVSELSAHNNYGHAHTVHASLAEEHHDHESDIHDIDDNSSQGEGAKKLGGNGSGSPAVENGNVTAPQASNGQQQPVYVIANSDNQAASNGNGHGIEEFGFRNGNANGSYDHAQQEPEIQLIPPTPSQTTQDHQYQGVSYQQNTQRDLSPVETDTHTTKSPQRHLTQQQHSNGVHVQRNGNGRVMHATNDDSAVEYQKQ